MSKASTLPQKRPNPLQQFGSVMPDENPDYKRRKMTDQWGSLGSLLNGSLP